MTSGNANIYEYSLVYFLLKSGQDSGFNSPPISSSDSYVTGRANIDGRLRGICDSGNVFCVVGDCNVFQLLELIKIVSVKFEISWSISFSTERGTHKTIPCFCREGKALLLAFDVPKQPRSHIIEGTKTGRLHHHIFVVAFPFWSSKA